MVYSPKVNVFDESRVKPNITAYLQANQADALKWANGGTALDSIAKFFSSPRLVTVFPALTFLQTSHRTVYEDLLDIDLELVIELAVTHGNQDTLSDISPKYSMALESMIVNMPMNSLLAGSIVAAPAFTVTAEVTFDIQGKFKSKFIQVLQQRYAWKTTAPAFV